MNKQAKRKLSIYLVLLILIITNFITPIHAIANNMNSMNQEVMKKQTNLNSKLQQSDKISEKENNVATSKNNNEGDNKVEADRDSTEVNMKNLDANLNNRGINLFKNIRVTDEEGNEFTDQNTPKYNDNLHILIDWSLDNAEPIKSGDFFTYKLPPEFAIHNEVFGYLKKDNEELSMGEFSLSKEGILTVKFNLNSENLSERQGTIQLNTELSVSKEIENVEINTGIFNQQNEEIVISFPIFQMDISKLGTLSNNGIIDWQIIFNEKRSSISNGILTDKMPVGLKYVSSKGFLYDDDKQKWVEVKGLISYNAKLDEFKLNQVIKQPVKVEIKSSIVNTQINSFTNVVKLSGNNFNDVTANATVSYEDTSEYKRFLGYNKETKRMSWEVSLNLNKNGGSLTDRLYDLSVSPDQAKHFLIPESISVKNQNKEEIIMDDSHREYIEFKDNQVIMYKLTFDDPGMYKVYYETELFEFVEQATEIKNLVTVEDETIRHYEGKGTVTPFEQIVVKKTVGEKDYENQTVPWLIVTNKAHLEISNLVITDMYAQIDGKNQSALRLIADSLIVESSRKSGEKKKLIAGQDYIMERIPDESNDTYEKGFKITLIGEYQTTSDQIDVSFVTKFNIPQQIEWKDSANSRMTNSVKASYALGDQIYQEVAQANVWFDTKFIANALKSGVFVPKGTNFTELLQHTFIENMPSVFKEQIATSDKVAWLAVFNTLKQTLHKDTIIIDEVDKNQILKELAIYSVVVSGKNMQVSALKDRLKEGVDYEVSYNANKTIAQIRLLKETSETLALFFSADASESAYKYRNKITLKDGEGVLKASAEVEKSAKENWLSKIGEQNQTNSRLIDWEVLINKDSRTIHHAVIEDKINYNQQSFLFNDEGQPLVSIYKALNKDGQWIKGDKVELNDKIKAIVKTDSSLGIYQLKLTFDETLTAPYIISYQTKLDPGIQNNELVSNNVNLKGEDIEIHQVTKEIVVKSTDGIGTSSGVNGSLAIQKFDERATEEEKKQGIDSEAIFSLSRKNMNGEFEVVFPKIVVKNNYIMEGEKQLSQINNLRHGEYMIQEIQAPEGYQLDEEKYYFLISNDNPNHVFSLPNKKQVKATQVVIDGEKQLLGRVLKSGEFSFELLDKDGSVIQTAVNDAQGKFYFDPLTYTQAGDYHYTIREVLGTDSTITYDKVAHDVKVVVRDVSGQLEAKLSTEGSIIFKNVYQPTKGQVVIDGDKQLLGRALKSGEFSFELLDKDGSVIQTAVNDAQGKFYFDPLTYTQAGDYHYTIREVLGADSTITYDKVAHDVKVVVRDVSGQLEAKLSTEGSIIFKNVYQPTKGQVVIDGDKQLLGRALKSGEFSFELLDKDGSVIQTAVNDAQGKFYFDPLTYTQAGDYHYTIREVLGADSTITYDKVAHDVKVVVRDVSGQLEAEISTDKKIIFTNKFQDITNIKNELPKLGVQTALYLVLMGIMICVILILNRIKVTKKNKK